MHATRHANGFTLLELMVVLVLIGIILTFVVGTVGDGGRAAQLEQQTRRMQALIELVGEEAVLRSAVYGLRLAPHSYTFLQYDGEGWNPVAGDSLLKPRELPAEMEFELFLDGLAVGLEEKTKEDDSGEEPPPQLVFLPSGERTPFELALHYRDEESGYRLTALPLGPLQRDHIRVDG